MTGILLPIDLGEENVIQVFNGGMCLLHISMYMRRRLQDIDTL